MDYSNAYRQDGSPNPAHRLWCCVLSLAAVLLAALPGHAAVEGAALQLVVEAEPRLLLAAEPPAASPQQPLTLAMAQESKYALFFLCGLARLSGQVRRREAASGAASCQLLQRLVHAACVFGWGGSKRLHPSCTPVAHTLFAPSHHPSPAAVAPGAARLPAGLPPRDGRLPGFRCLPSERPHQLRPRERR